MDIGIDFFSYSNSSDSNYTRILINETYILAELSASPAPFTNGTKTT